MNKKVGIMTFSPNNINPGTIFQAWSLCHYIDSIPDLEAELISYEYWNRSIFNHGKLSLFNLWFNYTLWRSGDFQRKNLKRYPPQKSLYRENICTINGRYDMVIVGSDQVWNPKLTGFDKSFFLDFVKGIPKGAFAPSIGIQDWPKDIKKEVEVLLHDFSFIGVREKQAIPIVQALTEKPVHWSLDPTFLIDKVVWTEIASKPKEMRDGYIMEYCIMHNPLVVSSVEKASKQYGIPTIECYGGRKRAPSVIKKHNVGPDKWLGYILNSKLVITDSFHAVAFSINNNKPFYVILSNNSNRILSVLELFGLEDRVITKAEDMDFTKEIDWTPVNKKLEEVRKENQDWLKESIFKAFNNNNNDTNISTN